MVAPILRPRRSLSGRLLWLTVGVVLFCEAVVFVGGLTVARRWWLDRRLGEAQLAAVSVAEAPNGQVEGSARSALLHLSGAQSIRLMEPGREVTVLDAPDPVPAVMPRDLETESLPRGVIRAFSDLLDPSDRFVELRTPARLPRGATISVVLNEARLSERLRAYAATFALISVVTAIVAGGLVYFALLILLVRPMRHITGSLAAFRTDPERTPPLVPEETMPLPDDEMALAAHELGAMQRELRTALWRNARLAAIGTAVAKVSHDLRGILSPALLAAERLQSSEDASVRRAGDVLVRAVDRATELMRGTLDFAKEVPVAPERTRVALAAVTLEAVEQVRASAPGLRADIDVSDQFEIEADRSQLTRIFGNLIRNAAEAGAHGVRVTAVEVATEIEILVSDDASGLPSAVQASLFRPFVTGGRRGSTGLGLAIVRDLVRAHGGDVTLARTGPDGTCFRIGLPRGSRRTRPASVPSQPAQSGAQAIRPLSS